MRGSVRKRGQGYEIRLDLERDPTSGKRKQKSIGGFKTKKEAEKALAGMIDKVEKGNYFEADVSTLKEYIQYWMETYAKTNLAPSTYKRYELFAKDISPIEMIQLNKLKANHIQKLYNDMVAEGKKSNCTILKVHRFLHIALKHAVKWQMIQVNPTDAVQAPKPEKVEMKIWTVDNANQFLEDIKDNPIYIAVLIALHTGMRRAEICGLRWQDVDLNRGVLTIKNILQNIDGELKLKSPKTKKSARSVVLMDSTVKALKFQKKRQLENKLLLAGVYVENDHIFTWEDGRVYDPGYLTHKFSDLVKKYGHPRIRFHDLRHTHATLLLEQGVNPKVVSERLGHSTIAITLDTYSHVTETIQKEAVKKLEGIFG